MGGSSPNSDYFIFFGNCVFFVFFCVYFVLFSCFQKKKKLDRGVGGWGLANPSFSRIF